MIKSKKWILYIYIIHINTLCRKYSKHSKYLTHWGKKSSDGPSTSLPSPLSSSWECSSSQTAVLHLKGSKNYNTAFDGCLADKNFPHLKTGRTARPKCCLKRLEYHCWTRNSRNCVSSVHGYNRRHRPLSTLWKKAKHLGCPTGFTVLKSNILTSWHASLKASNGLSIRQGFGGAFQVDSYHLKL